MFDTSPPFSGFLIVAVYINNPRNMFTGWAQDKATAKGIVYDAVMAKNKTRGVPMSQRYNASLCDFMTNSEVMDMTLGGLCYRIIDMTPP